MITKEKNFEFLFCTRKEFERGPRIKKQKQNVKAANIIWKNIRSNRMIVKKTHKISMNCTWIKVGNWTKEKKADYSEQDVPPAKKICSSFIHHIPTTTSPQKVSQVTHYLFPSVRYQVVLYHASLQHRIFQTYWLNYWSEKVI